MTNDELKELANEMSSLQGITWSNWNRVIDILTTLATVSADEPQLKDYECGAGFTNAEYLFASRDWHKAKHMQLEVENQELKEHFDLLNSDNEHHKQMIANKGVTIVQLGAEIQGLRQRLAEAQTRELNKDFEYKRFRDFIADQSAYIGCAIMPAELCGDVDLLDWIDDEIKDKS